MWEHAEKLDEECSQWSDRKLRATYSSRHLTDRVQLSYVPEEHLASSPGPMRLKRLDSVRAKRLMADSCRAADVAEWWFRFPCSTEGCPGEVQGSGTLDSLIPIVEVRGVPCSDCERTYTVEMSRSPFGAAD